MKKILPTAALALLGFLANKADAQTKDCPCPCPPTTIPATPPMAPPQKDTISLPKEKQPAPRQLSPSEEFMRNEAIFRGMEFSLLAKPLIIQSTPVRKNAKDNGASSEGWGDEKPAAPPPKKNCNCCTL